MIIVVVGGVRREG